MFVGVLKCADCGFNMRANVSKGKRKDGSDYRYVGFICGNYARSGKSACTVHTIYEPVLTQLILEEIRSHARLAAYNEERVTDAGHLTVHCHQPTAAVERKKYIYILSEMCNQK